MNKNVAILYQAAAVPDIGSLKKPMKPGGYKDSGADIAFSLRSRGINIVTPAENPSPSADLDWVFPDTTEGIERALKADANTLWLNTVLFDGHPIEKFFDQDISFVGQTPRAISFADDKFKANQKLKDAGLTVAKSQILNFQDIYLGSFPAVVKPIRGRGSQGVSVVENSSELQSALLSLVASGEFGEDFILEEMLPGKEITITVMPPKLKSNFTALPPALRFNHQKGIAPYNGVVAVTANSRALTTEEMNDPNVKGIMRECERAAEVMQARAPIRVDCRQDNHGNYKIFDLNMKPNMTGNGRPGREDQDCLSAISAKAIGWSYADLLIEMLNSSWKSGKTSRDSSL